MRNIISLISGFIFSLGLIISQMINPEKVQGFLDVFGSWDVSLMFVMGAAVGINLVLFPVIIKRGPCLNDHFTLSLSSKVDLNLLLGSILFGVGWGVSGICPGPALVNLVKFDSKMVLFVSSMFFGMLVFSKQNFFKENI